MKKIHMVDLVSQYQRYEKKIDSAIKEVCQNAQFIKGPAVANFEESLAEYLGVNHVIGCANGTDALQIALMALELQPGDEVIVPAFTYVATAEVIGVLGLTPVMIDVDPNTFNITKEIVEKAITDKTKVIVPVHLFGQTCDMEPIVELAKTNDIKIIEDTAQAIGAQVSKKNGIQLKAGTFGDIGCTSFFPSKNLGCYGDGGAMFTNDRDLAKKIRMIANHGQSKKYHHEVIGCNSRLDTIQASILNIKLNDLNDYTIKRQKAAVYYDERLKQLDSLQIPERDTSSSHVFHQYTLKILAGNRNELREYLSGKGIPTGVYYPIPLYKQNAFKQYAEKDFELTHTEILCEQVISLPICPELKQETQDYIISEITNFYKFNS